MKKTITVLATAVLSMGAFASTTATVSTSTKKTTLDKFLEKSSLIYFSEYSGPNLKDSSDYTSANAWTQIKGRYQLNKEVTLFASHAFLMRQTNENANGEQQDQYLVDDFRVGGEMWSSYTKDIKFRNRARIESVGEAYEDDDTTQTFRLRASHLVSTTVNNVHGITGVLTFRKWFYDNANDQDSNSQYDLIPTAAYQYSINDKLSAYTEYSFGFNHVADTQTSNAQRAWQELYLGLNYSVARALSLGTYIYISGGSGANGMRADNSTQLKIQLSGRLF